MSLRLPLHAAYLALLAFALPDLAFALNSLDQSFCRIASIFQTTAEILGILGLSTFGIMLLLGKGTWGMALLHGVAGAIFLGAGEIAGLLGATGTCS